MPCEHEMAGEPEHITAGLSELQTTTAVPGRHSAIAEVPAEHFTAIETIAHLLTESSKPDESVWQ